MRTKNSEKKSVRKKGTEKGNAGKKSGCCKNLKRAIVLLIKDSPAMLPLTIFLSAAYAVRPYIGIFLSSAILTELADPARDMKHLCFLAVLLVGLNFLVVAVANFGWQLLDVLKYVEYKKLDQSIAAKAWQMDYSMNEDPDISEKKKRMTHWGYDRGVLALARHLYIFLMGAFSIGISIVLVVEFLFARAAGNDGTASFLNHWSAGVLFLALFILQIVYGIWTDAGMQKRYYQADKDASKPQNQVMSLMRMCSEYHRGKDIRMFGTRDLICRNLEEKGRDMVEIMERTHKYVRRRSLSATLVSRFFTVLVYLFVGIKAIYKAFEVGSILKYTGMVNELGNGVNMLFYSIREFMQNLHYIDDYFAFQDMPNNTADGTLPVTEEIKSNYEFEFRNVTFTYPGASSPSLTNISCRFRKGEKLAVVGRNGSGKTTFIKLLCRLYDPQEGEILLNGVNIRKYQYGEYLGFFSTVFQDYQIFAFLLGENVAAESKYDRDRAAGALRDAGFEDRMKALEKGLDTQLYKFFSEEGVELSGGESQKVAIARCLYKDAPYVVMDEPTAALDPVAEADIYQRMNQFTRDKGAIYISHRLSSCHFCDRILVFEKGQIAEEGGHGELLAAKGLYRRLWDAQAKYYA